MDTSAITPIKNPDAPMLDDQKIISAKSRKRKLSSKANHPVSANISRPVSSSSSFPVSSVKKYFVKLMELLNADTGVPRFDPGTTKCVNNIKDCFTSATVSAVLPQNSA